MKLFTILVTKDTAPLQQFVKTAQDIGASGVTIFARPIMLEPNLPPNTRTEKQLQEAADEAAAGRNYKEAARLQTEIDSLRVLLQDAAREGAKWIEHIVAPIKEITQLIVLGNLHWDINIPFNQPNFFARLDDISTRLMTTGIGGIVQRTPLNQRTFIPLVGGTSVEAVELSGGPVSPASWDAGTSPPEDLQPPIAQPQYSKRHPSLPKLLSDKQAEYATARLGLDRGGQRRSRNEAGNLRGYSPNIAAKVENGIVKMWPEFLVIVEQADGAAV